MYENNNMGSEAEANRGLIFTPFFCKKEHILGIFRFKLLLKKNLVYCKMY